VAAVVVEKEEDKMSKLLWALGKIFIVIIIWATLSLCWSIFKYGAGVEHKMADVVGRIEFLEDRFAEQAEQIEILRTQMGQLRPR